MLAGIMEYVWRAIVVINVNITMFTYICRSFHKNTPTQSCISFMFQHATLKRRWPAHNLALVLCFNMWLCRNIFVFWHFDMTHYSQRNFEIHYLASVLFSHVTQKSLTWLTYIYAKPRVFSPFVMILSHAYTFSIRNKTVICTTGK